MSKPTTRESILLDLIQVAIRMAEGSSAEHLIQAREAIWYDVNSREKAEAAWR